MCFLLHSKAETDHSRHRNLDFNNVARNLDFYKGKWHRFSEPIFLELDDGGIVVKRKTKTTLYTQLLGKLIFHFNF